MRHSFHQFQMESGVADLQKKKDGLEVDFGAAEVEDEAHVVPYFRLSQLLDKENQKLKEILFRPENILPFLNAGRLVSIKDGDIDWGVGVVVKFDRRLQTGSARTFSTSCKCCSSARCRLRSPASS